MPEINLDGTTRILFTKTLAQMTSFKGFDFAIHRGVILDPKTHLPVAVITPWRSAQPRKPEVTATGLAVLRMRHCKFCGCEWPANQVGCPKCFEARVIKEAEAKVVKETEAEAPVSAVFQVRHCKFCDHSWSADQEWCPKCFDARLVKVAEAKVVKEAWAEARAEVEARAKAASNPIPIDVPAELHETAPTPAINPVLKPVVELMPAKLKAELLAKANPVPAKQPVKPLAAKVAVNPVPLPELVEILEPIKPEDSLNPLTEAELEWLHSICFKHPSWNDDQVAVEFMEIRKRPISLKMVGDNRPHVPSKFSGLIDPEGGEPEMALVNLVVPTKPLNMSERDTLRAIWRENTGVDAKWVADRFLAYRGRSISVKTANLYMPNG